MASHMQPPRSKARPIGVLAVALGVGLSVLVIFDRGGDDDDAALVRDAASHSTAPTVLGEVVEGSTTLPAAPPASPATFATATDAAPSDGTGATSPAPTQPPGTTSPTILPPVSITSPDPPRTTTTTEPTTTTEATTTTSEPTTTTEPPGG